MDLTSRVAVCSRSFSQHPVLRKELLDQFANVKFNDLGKSLEGPELVNFLKGSDRAIIALERVDENLLRQLPELKVVGKYGVGLDKIDFKAMDQHNVKMGWTAGVNAQAVAELTLALALILVRNIDVSKNLAKNGGWKQISGRQLSTLNFGILGCGHVGKSLVKLLVPFSSKIFSHDIADQSEFYKAHNVKAVSLEELIESSDIVSVHIPKNKKTENILSRSLLEKMKPGSFLINTARGGLVDENAVLDFLNSGHLAAAAFDVFAEEPPSPPSALIQHPRLYATTHIGGSSEEAVLAMGRAAIRGLQQFQTASLYEQ